MDPATAYRARIGGDPRSMSADEFNQGGLGIAPVAPALSEMDMLKARFGYSGPSELTPKQMSGDVAARQRILSKGTDLGMREYRPEPKAQPKMGAFNIGGEVAPIEMSIPDFGAVDQENDQIRARNLEDISRTEGRQAQIESGNAVAAAEIQRQEQLENQRRLWEQYGTDDPKLIQFHREEARKASYQEGFDKDMAAMDAERVRQETAAKTPEEIAEIRATFNSEFQKRLMRYTTDMGQRLPNAAFEGRGGGMGLPR